MNSRNRKIPDYWDNFENLRTELLAFLSEYGLPTIPARSVFIKYKRYDLSNAIGHHGGSYVVAEKLGLQLAHGKKPQKYWNDFENLKRELLGAMKENGWQTIPIQPKLVAAGRQDLAIAMTKHGGIYKVAEILKIGVETQEKPNGYWTLERTLKALREYVTEYKIVTFPTNTELEAHNRHDLVNAINYNSGTYHIAPLLNLKTKNKQTGYWSLDKLIYELSCYLEENGISSLPLLKDLKSAGRKDLVSAIAKFGGIHKVAKIMGKSTSSKNRPIGYWTIDTLKLEFGHFLKENNLNRIPTYDMLVEMGRQDLTGAIVKFGGIYKVAEILGVEISATGKPNGYWTLEATRKELFEFMQMNNISEMPSGKQLLRAGRADLLSAIQKLGGIYESARIFSLNTATLNKPPAYWTLSNVKKEIVAFMKENGLETFPTTTYLYEKHRSDIVSAIGKHGGVFAVANECNIPFDTRKPFGYWNLETIREELFEFMKQNKFTRIPTKTFFEESGRTDLLGAIGLHGGLIHMAELFGLEMENPYRPAGYWCMENLEIELVKFLEENNLDSMPSMEFIKAAGRGDLEGAIAKFGGILKVCQVIGIEINFDPKNAFHHYTSYAEDGHFCYSKYEKIIDDWLYFHGVQHEKEVRYPYHPKYNQSNYVCDWLCGDIYVEYAGMMNIVRYARSIQNKKALAKDLGLKVLVLLPKDMDDLENKLCAIFNIESQQPKQLSLF